MQVTIYNMQIIDQKMQVIDQQIQGINEEKLFAFIWQRASQINANNLQKNASHRLKL